MDSPNDLSPLDDAHWTALAAPKPSAAFATSLREQTSGLVRRRGRRRRWRVAGGLALAYSVGVITAQGWSRATPNSPRVDQQAKTSGNGAQRVERSPVEVASLDPEQLRRLVPGVPRADQIQLLRLAGDRYFYESADMRSALDCYRQVIELTPDETLLRPDPQDNWLLAELKLSAAAKLATRE